MARLVRTADFLYQASVSRILVYAAVRPGGLQRTCLAEGDAAVLRGAGAYPTRITHSTH